MADLDALAPAIAAGDPNAFEAWAAGSEARIRDSLASFAASVDVEAVVQETLLRVWQVAPRFRADGAPNGLLRLAIRTARNLAVSEQRGRGRVAAEDERELARNLDAVARDERPAEPDPLLRRLIQACLRALPPRPRAALQARLGAGGRESDGALAEELGMQTNTFLQNVTRARRALAECLARGGFDVEVAP